MCGLYTNLRWDRESTGNARTISVLASGGRWIRAFVLDEPEIRDKIINWIYDKDGEPGIMVTSFKYYINSQVTKVLWCQSCSACGKQQGAGCTHQLGIKYQTITLNEKMGFVNGHERLNVKTQWYHFMKIMNELGKDNQALFILDNHHCEIDDEAIVYQWHLNDDDPDVDDEVRR